jgi:hypothetical protein
MTSIVLLIICVAAQVLIAGWLGIYLYRRLSRERKEKKSREPEA